MIVTQFSTVEDMAKFAEMLANIRKEAQAGETNGKRSARLSGEIAAYTHMADILRKSTIRQADLIDDLFFA